MRENRDAVLRMVVGDGSPVRLHGDVYYIDILAVREHTHRVRHPEGMRGFIYLVNGAASVEDNALTPGSACFFEAAENPVVTAGAGARLVLIAGRPFHEPIELIGSFVE
jgi:redox-sensitive bicupin YhaK (pirin superfamily)